MTKSSTFLLAFALLAPLLIATSPVQAVPISSPSTQHTKRDAISDAIASMIAKSSPFTDTLGQGGQYLAAQAAGAVKDAAVGTQQPIDRGADTAHEVISGTGRNIANAPATLRDMVQAANA